MGVTLNGCFAWTSGTAAVLAQGGRGGSIAEGHRFNSDGELVVEGDCPTTDDDSQMDSNS